MNNAIEDYRCRLHMVLDEALNGMINQYNWGNFSGHVPQISILVEAKVDAGHTNKDTMIVSKPTVFVRDL